MQFSDDLGIAANVASVVSAAALIPAAITYMWKAFEGRFRMPRGLRVRQRTSLPGDLGFNVGVLNVGATAQRMRYVGVMPTTKLPVWRLGRQISGFLTDIHDQTKVRAIFVRMNPSQVIEPGQFLEWTIPVPLSRDPSNTERESYSVFSRRWKEWSKERPVIKIVPYAILDDRTMVLGARSRLMVPPECLAMIAPCKCGHVVSQHDYREGRRMRRTPKPAPCQECKCRRYRPDQNWVEADLDRGTVVKSSLPDLG